MFVVKHTAVLNAKSGVIALTEALALELAPAGILVNAIAPGPILPPPDLSADEEAEVARATPLGRWGGADEIARAVVFLCETGFVTASVVDPFGNVLGIMYNPHYVETVAGRAA